MNKLESKRQLQRLLFRADFRGVKVRVGKEYLQGLKDVDVAIFPKHGTAFTQDEVAFLAKLTHGQATPIGVWARFSDIEGLGK